MITDKQAMLDHLQVERRRLEHHLARLTPAEMQQPGVVGEWSVKDILAHLAAWERLCLTWIDQSLTGGAPEVPAPGFTWKQIDRLNQQIFEQNCQRSLEDVMDDFHSTHAQMVERFATLSDEQIFTPGYFPWLGKAAFVRWASAYAAHDRWGKDHIHRWVKMKQPA